MVRPSVRPLGALQISVTALRILPKLDIMLEGDELGTVAEPDFPGKILLINYSWKQVLAFFGHFLEFGTSDRLDIAYDGSPKCFSSCGSGFGSCAIN